MGPAITMYLSKNAVELDNIRNMSPMQAAVRIENQIRAEAAKLKPKVSAAPPPVDTPQGAGSAPKAKRPRSNLRMNEVAQWLITYRVTLLGKWQEYF